MLKRLKRRVLHRSSASTAAPMPPGLACPQTPSQVPPAPVADNVYSSFVPQSTPRSAWGNAWEGAKTILRLVRDSAEAFPPLKSTAGGLLGLIDLIENTQGNKEDFVDLQRKLSKLVSILNQYKAKPFSASAKERIENLNSTLEHQLAVLQANDSRNLPTRMATVTQDRADIQSAYSAISNLISMFLVETTLSMELTLDETVHISRRDHMLNLLNRLEPVEKAKYDATISVVRRSCTEGTRQQVLSELLDWAMDIENNKVYWLNGMAGTGKTTIAYSFSRILKRLGMLGGTFFCSRNDTDCSAAECIPLTIAFQLAEHSLPILDALTQILDENLGRPGQNIGIRFDRVVVQPLCKASSSLHGLPIIVVIDALDECTDQRHVDEFLVNLWKHAASLPVKFFVTSRPDPQFHGRIYGTDTLMKKFHLHNVEESFVKKDIHLYVQELLGPFVDEDRKWSPMLMKLVERAGRLFIYAATACKYIRDATEGLHLDRLQSITDIGEQPSELQTADINELYMFILRKAYERREKREKEILDLVLRAVICVRVPLSVHTLAELLSLNARKVRGLLSGLHSVICVPKDNGVVTTLHASFPEYLKNTELSSQFGCMSVEATTVHCHLTNSSFHLMNKGLCFNICKMPSSCLSND